MLELLLDKTALQKFRTDCPDDNLEIFRDFEFKKRSISPDKDNKIHVRMPQCLMKIVKEVTGGSISKQISALGFEGRMWLKRDKLTISADICRTFFHDAVISIIDKVKFLLKQPEISGTDAILLVGGFSESPVLQNAIKKALPDKNVIIPKHAGLAVLKGAVIFGHNPSLIAERVCKYTYGIETTRTFIEGVHDPEKKITCRGEYCCGDLFVQYVSAGQSVRFGESQGVKKFFPKEDEQTAVGFRVFACTQQSPVYVTDTGCFKLGTLTVKIRDMTVPREDRTFLVSLIFSGTEISVKAFEERTGLETSASVNFLG